jgi:uncharacterized protein (TIGR00369 family)
LRFRVGEGGGVEAEVVVDHRFEGYAGMVHGGVIATLLDAAMTNCLFARGVRGVTADLHVRYRHPLVVGEACRVRAWVERATRVVFVVRSECRQGGVSKATGVGKFMAPFG